MEVPLRDCVVTVDEVLLAIRSGGGRGNPPPGPDGIPMRVWKRIPLDLLKKLAVLFSACLRDGTFPELEASQTRAHSQG